jgi:ABC-type glycerol-3-phosphate transport system permease component
MNSRFMPTWQRGVVVVILAAVGLLFLIPLWWNLVWATGTNDTIFSYPPTFLPGGNLIDNFTRLQERVDIWRAFFNSALVTGITVIGACIFCTLAGFAFAKYQFRFRNILFMLLVATLAVPSQLTVVPLFIMMVRLGWVDSYQGLILPGLIPAFGVFFMRVSAQSAIPTEIMEAARIDGANELRILRQIALPSLLPAVATLAILIFGGSWGSLFWPLIILRSNAMFTLPLTLTTLLGSYQNPYDLLMVGSLLMMLPPLVLFLFMQRYFIKSVFLSGLH